MLHPSNMAIDYIWDRFSKTFFEQKTTDIMKDMNHILLAKNHRPLNPNTENHKKFLKTQIDFVKKLSSKYPFIDLNTEKKYFESSF